MKKNILFRIFFDSIFLLALSHLNFYLAIFIALIALFYFSFYWEFLFFAAFLDLIYGTVFYNFNFLYLVLALIIFILMEIFKKNVFS